jgi:hypothetical protein
MSFHDVAASGECMCFFSCANFLRNFLRHTLFEIDGLFGSNFFEFLSEARESIVLAEKHLVEENFSIILTKCEVCVDFEFLMMLNFNMKRDGKCSKKFCIYLWENI